MKNKKILVLSNACFSETDANGRTLMRHFQGFMPENLAQFYVYGTPDASACSTYYRVSDRDALNSLLRFRQTGGPVCADTERGGNTAGAGRTGKTPFKMLLRELAWKLGRWKGSRLDAWIKAFAPDCVLVFAADNCFLPDLARWIAKRYGIPAVLYSTEDYFFKEYNYLTQKPSLMYRLFHALLKRSYRCLEPWVAGGILNSEMLRDTYQQTFSFPCTALYAQSDLEFIPRASLPGQNSFHMAYLGNLRLGRHRALMQLADCAAEILPGAMLDVYGGASDEVLAELQQCPHLRYRGVVSYQQVVQVMRKSDLLVHAEYNDDFLNRDLLHAFSTKIADSVSSGTPLLVFAPPMLTEVRFVKQHGCAFAASTPEELTQELCRAMKDESARRAVLAQAQKVRSKIFCCPGGMERALDQFLHQN